MEITFEDSKVTLFPTKCSFVEEAVEYGENRPPLSKKCEYLGQKQTFSAKIRTMSGGTGVPLHTNLRSLEPVKMFRSTQNWL